MINECIRSTIKLTIDIQDANLQKTIYLAIQKWILFFYIPSDRQDNFTLPHFQRQIHTVSGCWVVAVFYGTFRLHLAWV